MADPQHKADARGFLAILDGADGGRGYAALHGDLGLLQPKLQPPCADRTTQICWGQDRNGRGRWHISFNDR